MLFNLHLLQYRLFFFFFVLNELSAQLVKWKCLKLFLRCLVEVTGLRIMYRNSSFAKYPNVMVSLIKAISVNQKGKILVFRQFQFSKYKKILSVNGIS